MSEILDSGNRRQFASGAVRDIAEGKGRMDLVPLEVVAELYNYIYKWCNQRIAPVYFDGHQLCASMNEFIRTGNLDCIFWLLRSCIYTYYGGSIESAVLDLSIHYEQGAKKYKERNWEQGIDCHCYVDSALRHGLKVLRRDEDEPHVRALMWNLMGLVWTIWNIPELNDLPYVADSRDGAASEAKSREEVCNEIIQSLEKGRRK